MEILPFELERWQSAWENRVELNLAESGVEPLATRELVEDPRALEEVLRVRLGYPQTNGSGELRSRIAALYPGARAENVLVTCGGAEANFLVTWALLEPGDEVVFMQPNYMQVAGLARSFGAAAKPLWRRLALPQRIKRWSLTSLQQRLVKTGGRLVRHARYYWLLLAEGHLSRRLFGSILRMIVALPLPDG